MATMIVTLEGNIGAGKTTLATMLCDAMKRRGRQVVYLAEPVDAWTDFHGTNLLKLFYTDTARWGFTFQVNALLTMTELDKRAVDLAQNGKTVIKERSSFSARNLFVPLLEKRMVEAEFRILTNLCEKMEDPRVMGVAGSDSIRDVTLYLRTDPDVCYQRILNRNRSGETGGSGGIELDYLRRLHERHETVRFIGETMIVNGNRHDPSVSRRNKRDVQTIVEPDSTSTETLVATIVASLL